MLGFNFGKEKNKEIPIEDNSQNNRLEQFFEDEDWEIGSKGGEVDKEEEIDWSKYDFMHTFDDLPESSRDQDENN